jgi:LPS export ABC transporter protein LptC
MGLVFWMGCSNIEVETSEQDFHTPPHLAMQGWQTVVTRQGHQLVSVHADSLTRSTPRGKAQFEGDVRVVFYNAKGDTASILSADKGTVDSGGQNITVMGQVIVMAGDSTRLETDSLRWDRENERIYGDGLVSIFRPEGTERGVGFDASADLKQWTLRQVETHVTGKVK